MEGAWIILKREIRVDILTAENLVINKMIEEIKDNVENKLDCIIIELLKSLNNPKDKKMHKEV